MGWLVYVGKQARHTVGFLSALAGLVFLVLAVVLG